MKPNTGGIPSILKEAKRSTTQREPKFSTYLPSTRAAAIEPVAGPGRGSDYRPCGGQYLPLRADRPLAYRCGQGSGILDDRDGESERRLFGHFGVAHPPPGNVEAGTGGRTRPGAEPGQPG